MSKIIVNGDAVTITSALKLEDIRFLQKYRPEACYLYEENENKEMEPVFAVCAGAFPSFDSNGAVFAAETRDEEKLAYITFMLPSKLGDIKAYVADKFGTAITRLNKLEEDLPDIIELIKEERDAIMEGITIAQ